MSKLHSTEEETSEEETTTTINKVDQNASFWATFIDGSSLRYLIEYLRMSSTEGTFIFTKDEIIYQKQDEDQGILNDVRLKTYELIDYEFDSENPEIIAIIDLSNLRNKTRTVGKKEQLDIYRIKDEPSNFYVQVRSQEKSSGDNPVFYCMKMRSEDVTLYELPIYSRGKKNPNCTIYQTDFSKVCKALVTNKCTYTEFTGYERGIIIKGYTNDGQVAMVKQYGKCQTIPASKSSTAKSVNTNETLKSSVPKPKLNIKDSGIVEKYRVHISTIKSLAKINGFSGNGTIKIYIEKGLPMKITSNVGSFGKLNIIITSVE